MRTISASAARILAALLLGVSIPSAATAQSAHDDQGKGARQVATQAREPGQAAFAAIAEIVALLEADAATDWSKVDLEALRQHLADMDDVVLRAEARSTAVAGGLQLDVTGAGRTAAAIARMLGDHAGMLDALPEFRAKAAPIPGGMRLVVTAENADDAKTVTRIRGLGFAGLLVTGAHHTVHHLAIARGEGAGAHRHR